MKYAELFNKLNDEIEKIKKKDKAVRDEFKNKNIKTEDFSKKLMGQIVFLYFLQKKGWLGVEKGKQWGTGPHNFMRRLATGEYGTYKNFFNDRLEPLFYDTLASDRGHEAYCEIFKRRIPFLNGGLFEPLGDYDWKKTDIVIPDRLFINDDFVEEGIFGTGVLDVFDRYNFTVNEAEPLEKEVAIDPEMLGKVFENLIEENRRKGLGAFYTPREIVHYMCQECLINYLDTALSKQSVDVPREEIEQFIHMGEQISPYDSDDFKTIHYKLPKGIKDNARLIDETLTAITVCDPAVGSGAFLVGMLTEIVKARLSLTPHFNDVHDRVAYFFKRDAIQKSLYGVDIDAGAVEIAKLRLWFSLVVDEEDVKQIKPLPNLDYKIVEGNSLIGLETEANQITFIEDDLSELEKLKRQEFDETNHKKKLDLKKKINDELDILTNGKRIFDYSIYFSEVVQGQYGFDVIIGNPPYVRQEKIKEYKPQLKKQFNCYTGVADIYVYFYEKGYNLLRKNGVLAFITSNKYMRAGYGEKLREFLADKAQILQLIDFGDAPVFEATAYPSIIVLKKEKTREQVKALNWERERPVSEFESVVHTNTFFIEQRKLTPDGWRIESPFAIKLFDKIRAAGQPLGEYVNGKFYRGILTGLNEAFVVDRATRDALIAEHPSSEDVLKPFLRGRDVKRWCVDSKDLWLIYIPWHFPLHLKSNIKGASEEAEKAFKKQYPAIYRYLLNFKDKLAARNQAETGIRYEWYACQRWGAEYWREFEKPKIIYPDIAKKPEFSYDPDGYLLANTLYLIPSDTTVLSGFLNSKVLFWYYTKLSSQIRGDFVRFIAQYVSQLPISTTNDTKQIEKRVTKILDIKEDNPVADVTELEQEINELVYKLYGLTKGEIKYIEESV
ncbi:MAG: TaqI-like C-terminal specificity domain-containing protein [Candidatus Hinthialibacter antarcticus]|nr:TaqI-like C-terminal specificity domain-containing protein [Candidatus Hinthialibacter antarcticus]